MNVSEMFNDVIELIEAVAVTNSKKALSLKEQENKDDFELGKKEGIRFANIKNKKTLASLQEKIICLRRNIKNIKPFEEEIQKIFQEMGK